MFNGQKLINRVSFHWYIVYREIHHYLYIFIHFRYNFGALVASKGKSTGGSVSTQLCENGSKIKGLYGNVGMFENSTMVTALGVICGINQ